MVGMWIEWVRDNWDALAAGDKISVPYWLIHPSLAGFSTAAVATPQGQVRNWVLSLSDGSRLHVHEFSDGRLLAHRDRHDPAQGVTSALKHVLLDTGMGQLLLLGGTIVVVSKLARA